MSEPFLPYIIESIPLLCMSLPFMRRVVLFNHCLAFIINAVITIAAAATATAECGCGKQDSALADTEEESTINADGHGTPFTALSFCATAVVALIGTCLGPNPRRSRTSKL